MTTRPLIRVPQTSGRGRTADAERRRACLTPVEIYQESSTQPSLPEHSQWHTCDDQGRRPTIPSTRTRPGTTWLIISALAASSWAAPVLAQTLDRAEINGTIRDETGAVLDGVTVTLRDTRTGLERTTATGRDGQYSAPLMPVGVYVVKAERTGFAAVTSEPLSLTVGHALVVNVVMKIAPGIETVSVFAAGNTAPALGLAVGNDALQSLPINGRDYRDVALLAPTARTITGTRGTFRMAGQPGDYLALSVDGADFTNSFFGEFFGSIERQNFTIPLEAVQEFDVSTGGSGA